MDSKMKLRPGKENLRQILRLSKSNRKAINRNWSNQKPNPALKWEINKNYK